MTPEDRFHDADASTASRIDALLSHDPSVVWTAARLVAATGADPRVVARAVRLLVARGRALDVAPRSVDVRVRGARARAPRDARAPDGAWTRPPEGSAAAEAAAPGTGDD